MDKNSTFKIPTHVMTRVVGSETVVLDLESGTYFGLDPIGTRIWQLLEERKSLAGISDVMIEDFEVSKDDLERDALAFAQELLGKNLISLE